MEKAVKTVLTKAVKTALANVDTVVSNVTMKRNEHGQLMNDIQLIGEQCEKASIVAVLEKKIKKLEKK